MERRSAQRGQYGKVWVTRLSKYPLDHGLSSVLIIIFLHNMQYGISRLEEYACIAQHSSIQRSNEHSDALSIQQKLATLHHSLADLGCNDPDSELLPQILYEYFV